MSTRPELRALATHCGIADGYHRAGNGHWHATSDETRVALLEAMGHAAGSEAEAAYSLAALLQARTVRWLEPVYVLARSQLARGVPISSDAIGSHPAPFEASLRSEHGDRELGGRIGPGAFPHLPLPADLPLGEYDLEVSLTRPVGRQHAAQRLVIVPDGAWAPESALPPEGAFGLVVQLYATRRRDGFGVGDVASLHSLVDWTARLGGAFVASSPLHALANREERVCPYWPISRLFRNPIYLAPERTPEWADCEAAQRLASSAAVLETRRRLQSAPRIDQPAAAALLRDLHQHLFETFQARERRRPSARGEAFARYRAEQGDALEGFATFMVVAEMLEREGAAPETAWDWRRWPEPLRDRHGPAVQALQTGRADAISLHAWLQFELDRQLGELAADARRRGLALGLCTDLALGSAAGGADEWHGGSLYAGASTGAPPDDFAPTGQDWSFPPLDPAALARDGYRLWSRMLRATFAHAGAVRIDHALWLRRLFWIPAGRAPSEGAYVAYPEEDLLGVLALESHRQRALVVAEDLGTVPEGFSESIRERGLLSSRVLLFERDEQGLTPPRAWPRRALATASTHDLPPLAAWRGEADLELRRRAGQLLEPADFERERRSRVELQQLLRRDLPFDGDPLADDAALAAATTRFLCDTACLLVGLAVDDLAGEAEPQNLPGVSPAVHPSWTRAVRTDVEDLPAHPVARAAMAAVPRSRRSQAAGANARSTRGSSTDPTTSGQA